MNTGVTLAPDVLTYLSELSKREDRDRSWLINSIVREHARRHNPQQENAPRRIALFTELDLLNPKLSRFFPYLFTELKAYFKAAGYQTQLYTGGVTPPNEGISLEIYDEFIADLKNGKICGTVAMFSLMFRPEWIQRMAEAGVPVVGELPNFPYAVEFPMKEWMSLAIRHLVSQGRRRIGIMGWGASQAFLADPFRQVMAEMGLTVHPNWVRSDLHPNARGAGWAELREVWTSEKEKPDGLLITDDLLVPDACAAISDLGLRVPEQLAIVAHSNKECPFHATLPVTRLEYNSAAHVQAIGELMLKLVRGEPVTNAKPQPRNAFQLIEPEVPVTPGLPLPG